MKKSSIKFFFLVAVLFTVSFAASAQIYVRIRPTFPVVVRPPQPSNVHVWVNEEWEQDGSSYRYSGGHWASPPHKNYYYRPGRWQRGRHGQRWIPGRWDGGRRRH